MVRANPDYNPDWNKIYNQQEIERDDIANEIAILRKHEVNLNDGRYTYYTKENAGQADDTIRELLEEINALEITKHGHQSEMQRCLELYQHETMQGAIDYIIAQLDSASETALIEFALSLDANEFENVDDFLETLDTQRIHIAAYEIEQHYGLQIGQPGDQNIFEDIGTNQITSAYHTFTGDDLKDFGFYTSGGYSVSALVVIDKRDDEYHISLEQDHVPMKPGESVEMQYLKLASAIYWALSPGNPPPLIPENSLQAFLYRNVTEPFKSVARTLSKDDSELPLPPGNFYFYLHQRPQHNRKEAFLFLDMDFKNGQFLHTRISPFNCVPRAIKEAHSQTHNHGIDFESIKHQPSKSTSIEDPYTREL